MIIYDLEKVANIRDIFYREDYDFTPWIADNLPKINKLLGLNLALLEKEANCGKYRLDIKAKDISDDSIAIIENQYGYTNHDHLGKLITYASGFEAKHIIWITEDYNDEHRSAMDWLNEISHEDVSFFLLQIEFVKINNSDIASNFKVICKPNNWSKVIKDRATKEYTDIEKNRLEFWSDLYNYAIDNNYKLAKNIKEVNHQRYSNISINSKLSVLNMNVLPDKINVRLYIYNSEELFNYLLDNKEEIESKLGAKLIYSSLSTYKKSEIAIENTNYGYNNYNADAYKWMLDTLEKMYDILPDYVINYEESIQGIE